LAVLSPFPATVIPELLIWSILKNNALLTPNCAPIISKFIGHEETALKFAHNRKAFARHEHITRQSDGSTVLYIFVPISSKKNLGAWRLDAWNEFWPDDFGKF